MADPVPSTRYRDKLTRELRTGVVGLTLLFIIDRTGPDYGYHILRRIEEQSGGRLAFKEGTAYPVLQNLERQGLVSTYWGESQTGPPRKYYQITREGREALDEGLAQWRDLRDSVERILGGRPKEARKA